MSAAQPDPPAGPAVIVPGNHDGVHRGHRSLLQQARALAERRGVPDVQVLTFDPHPAALLAPERAPTPLTTPERRVELLRHYGADRVRVEPFTREFASQSPLAFMQWLQRQGARGIVVGPDFCFGKDRAGNVSTLQRFGAEHDIAIEVAREVLVDGERVSSSAIRSAVAAGDLARASQLLGRLHDVRGEVVVGHRRGRTLGFPTANLAPDPVLLPADGVYAVVARVLDADPVAQGATGKAPEAPPLLGVANIGQRPTFEAGRSIEVHLFDFDDDIYGRYLRVGFVERIRGEEKFPSMDALRAQIQVDSDTARATLASSSREGWAWI